MGIGNQKPLQRFICIRGQLNSRQIGAGKVAANLLKTLTATTISLNINLLRILKTTTVSRILHNRNRTVDTSGLARIFSKLLLSSFAWLA